MKETRIYAALDPRDSSVRYVGKTTNSIRTRAAHHFSKKGDDKRSMWFQSLMKEGIRAEFVEIDVIPARGDWSSAEEFWINYFRFLGADLVNGQTGHALRLQRSKEAKGRPWTEARWNRVRPVLS